jgi:hypothetical protein
MPPRIFYLISEIYCCERRYFGANYSLYKNHKDGQKISCESFHYIRMSLNFFSKITLAFFVCGAKTPRPVKGCGSARGLKNRLGWLRIRLG